MAGEQRIITPLSCKRTLLAVSPYVATPFRPDCKSMCNPEFRGLLTSELEVYYD